MQALLFSWLTYLVGAILLEKRIGKVVYLIGAFITLIVYFIISRLYAVDVSAVEALWIVYFYFIYLHVSQWSRLLSSLLFFVFLAAYLASTFYFPEYSKYILGASPVLLMLRTYSSKGDFVFWGILVLTVSGTYLIDRDLFYYGNIPFVFYFIRKSVKELFEEVDREKRRYRDFVDRAISSEIQKKASELDDELKITYKKLKVIFKLSNDTLSPLEIEDIAERVVEGLHNLGYSGVVLYVNTGNFHAFKKSGFFPYMKNYLENRFESIEKITISDDEKQIFLPLKSDRGKIGVLAVYKKEGISPKEIEYLSTYANSVAISITKTIYFKEINKLQELLEKTFESVDIGVVILDRNYVIEKANSAMEKISGKKPEGVIFDVIPELEPLKDDFEKVLKERKIVDTIISSVHRKGSIYRVKAVPLISSDSDTVDKIVLVVDDITEFEKMKVQLLYTEKHAMLGRMAANLSHEIQNPLSVVSASAYVLKQKGEKLDDEEIVKLAEKIEKNTKRATNIMNRFLNYSKVSTYKKELVNMRKVILSSIEFASTQLKDRKPKIYRRLRSDVYVYGDEEALSQVFTNLIINAAEAVDPEKGIIEIKLTKDRDFAIASVKDNGTGIPENMISDIFDPFVTTKNMGTGLGLSIAKKIIMDHRGTIEVYSKLGEGTEFIIKLPLAKE
ncbi:two-component system sensor histidine kinase NtrB [Persephonella sp.]